jgi:hypothetical protein
MKAEHTPGTWYVHEGLDYIAVVRGNECIDNGIFVDNIGDANLIAAAPELYDALNNLQANPNDPRAHRAALDALKKARGEA